jgi:hypothetical protein
MLCTVGAASAPVREQGPANRQTIEDPDLDAGLGYRVMTNEGVEFFIAAFGWLGF